MPLLATLLGLVWTLLASSPVDACQEMPEVVMEACCAPVTACECCVGAPAPMRSPSLTDPPGPTPDVGTLVPPVARPVEQGAPVSAVLLAPRDGAERPPAGPRAPPGTVG